MSATGDNDLVSDINRGLSNVTDDDAQKQWKTICDCLEQMQWAGDHCGSPSPTPINNLTQSIAPASAQKNTAAPTVATLNKYRKSDGDLHSSDSSLQFSAVNPPQSAPVLFEGAGEFNWDYNSGGIKSHLRSKSAQNTDISNPIKANFYNPHQNPVMNHDQRRESDTKPYVVFPKAHPARGDADHDMYMRNMPQGFSGANPKSGNSGSFANHSHNESYLNLKSSPSLLPYQATDSPAKSYIQRTLYSKQSLEGSELQHQPILSNTYQIKDSRASQISKMHHGPLQHGQGNVDFLNQNISYLSSNPLSYDQSKSSDHPDEDEKGYTKVLLQHQRDRMNRLQSEFEMKKHELNTLLHDINSMEKELEQRNLRYKAVPVLPSLRLEIAKLREENRQLEIDCNCMYKEVDLYARDGDSTRDDFYSRYNRPAQMAKQQGKHKSKGLQQVVQQQPSSLLPSTSTHHHNHQRISPLPSSATSHHHHHHHHHHPTGSLSSTAAATTAAVRSATPADPSEVSNGGVDPDDDVKWRCKHCTFDNHSALENCEICEYRRDTHPS